MFDDADVVAKKTFLGKVRNYSTTEGSSPVMMLLELSRKTVLPVFEDV